MTIEKSKSEAPSSQSSRMPQLFTCNAPHAKEVFLAGDFNDWSSQATSIEKNADGTWMVALTLPAGRHEYKFVVDGAWCCEPVCERSMAEAPCSMCVVNERGTMNRVVQVK